LIALPSEIRKKTGLKEGDILKVEVKENEIVLKKEKRIYDLKGSIQKAKAQRSFEEILAEEMKKRGEK
jgi:AbrB family looped-hinge helix DNA binding protein